MTTFTGPTDCCCWDGSGNGCDIDVDPVTFGSCKLPGESPDAPRRENTDADAAYQTETGMLCKTDVLPNESSFIQTGIYIITNPRNALQMISQI